MSAHDLRTRCGTVITAVLVVIVISLGLLAGCALKPNDKQSAIEPVAERALVSEVIDGDTVRLADGRKVRYLGIDTPEIGEYFYEEATERNRELVEGKTVELKPGGSDVDKYGRLLRYVYVDGLFVNAELVAQGYAAAYRKGPREEYSEYLFQLEEDARANGLGMWAEP